ncbi:MAG: hypothetical protein U1F71_05310 [Verrucomicrobiaceae bacterium]
MSGLHRGYVCDCGGVEHLTQTDHCHGPHSAACHEGEEPALPHQHDDDDDGDTHQHAAVVDTLLAMQKDEAAMPVVVPVMLVGAADEFSFVCLPEPGANSVVNPPPRRSWGVQEWPGRLAQTIVLRI